MISTKKSPATQFLNSANVIFSFQTDVFTLKLMDDIFNWLSIGGRVGHLHLPRTGHDKVCCFVLWGGTILRQNMS